MKEFGGWGRGVGGPRTLHIVQDILMLKGIYHLTQIT